MDLFKNRLLTRGSPLVWRNSHPYSIIDNYRDVTHPTKIEEDEKCDRSIELSGYLRGTNFAAQGQRVHIPGLGDFAISSMEALPDPCPTPAMEQAIAKATGKQGRRRLDEKEKKLYAPFSDRSGLKVTGDHIVITKERGFTFNRDDMDVERGEGEQLIMDLQGGERPLLGQTQAGIELFAGKSINHLPEEEDTGRKSRRQAHFAGDDASSNDEDVPEDGDSAGEDDEDIGSDLGSDDEPEFNDQKLGRLFRKDTDKGEEGEDVAFADSDSDLGSLGGEDEDDWSEDDDMDEDDFEDDEEGAAVRWKANMAERAKLLHGKRRPYRSIDLARFMYDESLSPRDALKRWRGEEGEEMEENIEDEEDEEFFRVTKQAAGDEAEDRTIPRFDYDQLAARWSNEESIDELRQRFASANLLGDDAGEDDDFSGIEDDDGDDDDEGDGAFEDLETGEKHGEPEEANGEQLSLEAEREKNAKRKEELKARFEVEDREGFANDKANARREGGNEEFAEDEWYDAQKALIQKQLDVNRSEYDQLDPRQALALEGFRAGSYCRMVIDGVPCEFVQRFSPRMPIVVGGLSPTEDRFGFVQARIKKHRWHKKILKNGDPLIWSLGWRRFQSLPIFSLSDSRVRQRMLKYTPEVSCPIFDCLPQAGH